jgi:signal transduction histidine kinase
MRSTFKPRSIRLKLLLLVALAVALANLAVAGVSLWQEAARYASMKRDTLVSTAEVLAAAAARPTKQKDIPAIYEAIRAIGRVAGLTYVGVESADGRPMADMGATEQLLGDIVLDETSRAISIPALVSSRSIEVSTPIILAGETIGRLRLMSDTADLAPRLLATLWTTLAGLGIALALGLVVALRLQAAITRPLTALTKTMAKVTADHDYSASLVATTHDEVGVLVNGFNSMLSGIRERDANLARHREHLEREVSDRTADLRVARDAAEFANARKSEFLATMSHEIRTPMNGMLVMAELLAATDLPTRSRRYADVIARSGQSLLAIINDILDFSKVEAGKLELERVPTPACETVETVLSLFAERARSKGLDLAGYIAVDIPERIEADPVRLTQVLSNLVNNALKFTHAGGVTLSVERDPDQSRNLRFSVRDTGIGIPEDKIDTVFGAFSQADQSTTRQYGGTGLGLAICLKLVEAMGAKIEVRSKVGEGSIFSFSIPCLMDGEVARPWPRLAAGTRVSLCVVEAPTSMSLQRYLEAAGCAVAVIEATGIGRALAEPGFVVADAVTLRLVGTSAHSAVANVIELTALGEPCGDASTGFSDATLARPIARDELAQILARAAAGEPLRDVSVSSRVAATTQSSFTGARVLVADDSPVNIEVAIKRLRASASPRTPLWMAYRPSPRARRSDTISC